MVAANCALNLMLVFPLQERGLALATSICSGIQIVWLATRLTRTMPPLSWRPVFAGAVRIAAAAGVMCVALWQLSRSGVLGANRLVQLAVLVPTGVVAYLLAAWMLRMPELGWLMEKREGSALPSE
jgi:peptidoglycan biosynthesis protein MviN/MurJ (putative lipid II flippase)